MKLNMPIVAIKKMFPYHKTSTYFASKVKLKTNGVICINSNAQLCCDTK